MRHLSGRIFGLARPLRYGLLVQTEILCDLANLPVFVMKLVPNLEECVLADHNPLNLHESADECEKRQLHAKELHCSPLPSCFQQNYGCNKMQIRLRGTGHDLQCSKRSAGTAS